MNSLRVQLGTRSYPVFIAANSLAKIPEMLHLYSDTRSYVIITEQHVRALYGATLLGHFAGFDFVLKEISVPAGETSKSLDVFESVITTMLEMGVTREWGVIAFGGGVIGDLAGFVASSYMRGLPYFNIPTTLLAQVDASVGGKVGINHSLAKNIIGAFYQPKLVWMDPAILKSLDRREVLCGLAEVIKYGVIYDRGFFDFCGQHLDAILVLDEKIIEKAILRSVSIKAEVVAKDERENNLRAILNFGHTVGHALEKVAGYGHLRHGEAVFWGMLAEAWLAAELHLLPKTEFAALAALLRRIPLTATIEGIDCDEILDTIRRDKKVLQGHVRVVLPLAIGKVRLFDDVQDSQMRAALSYITHRRWQD